MNAFTNLLGGMTQVWLNVAFIVCVFGVLTFRPERIANPPKLKRAILLFSAALIIPSGSMLLSTIVGNTSKTPGFNPVEVLLALTNTVAIAFFCAAFILATSSLIPRPMSE